LCSTYAFSRFELSIGFLVWRREDLCFRYWRLYHWVNTYHKIHCYWEFNLH